MPTPPCNCDPAVLALVPDGPSVTYAARSGRWSAPGTWMGGSLPQPGATVVVPAGDIVTVDGVELTPLRWLRCDGTLEFMADRDTSLSLETLVVNDDGLLVAGTAAYPIHPDHQCNVTFLDPAPIDRTYDPLMLSRGLLASGRCNLVGAGKTAWLQLWSAGATQGDQSLVMAYAPFGWRVGDVLLLPGTTFGQDEEVVIKAVMPAGVSLTSGLKYDHKSPNGQPVYVGNLTRNLTFQSAPSAIADLSGLRRGHCMLMSNDQLFDSVAISYCGRTDKSLPINDPVLDSTGQLVPGTGTNPRARYGLHWHLCGGLKNDRCGIVRGAVVSHSRGWGVANHGSYVQAVDTIVYDHLGACIVAENGSEIGTFRRNLACHAIGDGQPIDARARANDWWHGGDGFGLQGCGAILEENVAAGCVTDYNMWCSGLVKPDGLSQFAILSANLPDPSLWPSSTVAGESAPLMGWRGNTGYGCQISMQTALLQSRMPSGMAPTVIDGQVAWGGRGFQKAYQALYTSNVILKNPQFFGDLTNPSGVGLFEGNEAVALLPIEAGRIEGMSLGINISESGSGHRVSGAYLNNVTNIRIPASFGGGRTVTIDADVQFGVLTGAVNIDLSYDPRSLVSHLPNIMAGGSTILWGTSQLYYDAQRLDYVPFTAAGPFSGIVPNQLVGLTNSQLWANYGMAWGDQIMPAGCQALQGLNGWIGAPAVPAPPYPVRSSNGQSQPRGPYNLSWVDSSGVNHSEPVVLVAGWNIFTRQTNGRLCTFWVFGT